MKITKIICDVIGCGEKSFIEVDCCRGWVEEDDFKKYSKFENSLHPEKTDLCVKHWKEWSKLTCKLLKMDKNDKK